MLMILPPCRSKYDYQCDVIMTMLRSYIENAMWIEINVLPLLRSGKRDSLSSIGVYSSKRVQVTLRKIISSTVLIARRGSILWFQFKQLIDTSQKIWVVQSQLANPNTCIFTVKLSKGKVKRKLILSTWWMLPTFTDCSIDM